ncbi:MAG: ACT domain-containing protein [Clostridia bacterium]|nr:ACT domain-containing protein [Clostridia bacterium]
MAIKQLSIFVENKEGKLAKITELLTKSEVDIRAMSIADTQDFGILRLIVSDARKAAAVLSENNCVVHVTDVIGVAVEDKPGGLAKVVRLLSDNNINIEYMYAFITISKQYAYVVFRVEDNEKASALLESENIRLVTEEDITSL